MTRPRHLLLLGAMSAGLVLATVLPASAAPSATAQAHRERVVCGTPAPMTARCHAHVQTKGDGVTPSATVDYSNGYGPADLQSAYNLTAAASAVPGTRPTIAIVDAYANPNIRADLDAYRAQFNLPAVNTGGPTFRVVDQTGGSNLPAGNTGWGQEIALDVDMASAICPECNILLVEAASNSYVNLGTAVNYAASQPGVVAVSNSYGGSEFSGETTYETRYYQHANVAVTVSSGDNGYGVEFPASSQYVTAVGGTSLKRTTTGRLWSESAWSGAGSGCSAYITRPSWQPATSACSRRAVADVSAVADPNTGVAVYDSYGSTGGANWMVFGGTSVSAPIIASVYALAGNATSLTYGSYPYSHKASLYDITSGSNGRCSTKRSTSGAYLCNAVPGYDGPTGLGTPNGTGGF